MNGRLVPAVTWLAWSLALAGCAATPPGTPGAEEPAPVLGEVLRRDPGARADYDAESGRIDVFGRLGRLEAVRSPDDFLADVMPARLVARPGYRFAVERERSDDRGWRHVTLRQEIDGIPVWNRRITLHVNPAGDVAAINGRFVPERATVTARAALEAGEALDIAVADAAGQPGSAAYPPYRPPELVLHESGGTFRTAWSFVLPGRDADGSHAEWRYFVDAVTGRILERYNEVRTMAATGGGIDCDLATRPLNLFGVDETFWMRDVTRIDRGGSEIRTRVPGGDFAEDEDANWDQVEVPVRDGQQAEVSIHYWLGESYDRLFELTGREGWDGSGARIEAYAHEPGRNNASWLPNEARLTFGESEGPRFRAFGCANDIVAHEFMHGVVHFTAGFGDDRDARALDESFADILGLMVDDEDWVLGEDASQFGTFAIRSAADPSAGGDPDHYSDANDSGHSTSNISSHAFYLAAEGLRHTGESGYECDVSLGREEAFRHFYYALENFLQPESRMPHLAVYVEYIAESILGLGREARADAFAEAFRRTGLGGGGRDLACAEPWFQVTLR